MKIAICICTCARPASLRRLLGALSVMEFGPLDARDICVVVIDNRPGGRVQDICAKAAGGLSLALHLVEEPERGISFARNRAISVALTHGAGLIAFIDDDDLPQPDWLVRLVARRRPTGADPMWSGRSGQTGRVLGIDRGAGSSEDEGP